MTLFKSLLLGSAAGLVAVSAAQAADLPTRKGPVAAEYVRVCSITVAGVPVVGFVLPGSDTCFKVSGYISAQFEGGNAKAGNAVDYTGTAGVIAGGNSTRPGPVAVAGNPAVGQQSFQNITNTFNRDEIGYSTRFNLTLDAVSNTAYGPLVAHGEYQFNFSSGYDNLGSGGSDGGINRAYVTWAGLTAGKANSFFAFTGGGYGYANFFSPDRQGFNQPDLVAYTASFGGGFAATISAESAQTSAQGSAQSTSAGTFGGYPGSNLGYLGSASQGGARIPDIVGALSVHEAWGRAQVSGVGHNVRAQSLMGDGATLDKWGYGVDAGLEFNIPGVAGSMIGVTGSYARNATIYSGLQDGVWGDALQQINGNGQGMALADAFANGNGTWATPEAWSVTGYASFAVSPTVTLQAEGSYGEIHWTGTTPLTMLSDSKSFIVGGIAHYDPVKNLDFEVELLYQDTKTSQPTGYVASATPGLTGSWQSKSDGFAARFQVNRSF
jgi:hypothetical protein